jgi:alpha-N-acetylglucosamine transferase
MNSGYLYVANQEKFIKEAMISAKSVRLYTDLPIALISTEAIVTEQVKDFFDIVIIVEELRKHTYLCKIIGLLNSPFDQTIFLDTDTFVCSNIDELFSLLTFVDIATTQESKKHTYVFPEIKFKNIFPEFNSGVIVFKRNKHIEKLFNDWFASCQSLKIAIDMPGLREAFLLNFDTVRFSILPEEYNSHGYKSMLILFGEVKVIHERIGTSWKTITPYFANFDEMSKFAAKINKKNYKRIYIPAIGIIPYNYNAYNILYKIKKILGIKRVSKNR